MKKRRVFLKAALALLTVLILFAAAAAGETAENTAAEPEAAAAGAEAAAETAQPAATGDDPLKVSMELSKNKFSEPETINVSITLTNVSDEEMPSEVTLYYPSGKQIEEFGAPVLGAGMSKNWSGTWTVTQSELEAGWLAFKAKYAMYNEEGTLVRKTKNFRKTLVYTGGEPELNITRTITPMTAQKDQEISVTYEIVNAGESDISNVVIKENSGISSKNGTLDAVKAGETGKYTFTTKMGSRDLTSAATITYKASGTTYTSRVEAATIRYGEVKLGATLKASKKGGAPGDTVTLTLTLKNSGTVDFTDVTATDAALGTVFSGVTVPKGETVTLETEMTITQTQDIQFTVTGVNDTGDPVETATGLISVIATDPTQQIALRVEAEADRDQVFSIPGTVKFTIRVHNDSAIDVANIAIKAVNTTVYTFDSIPAGETRSVTRDMDISTAGRFQFVASVRDQLDQTLTFESNELPIAFATPSPVPTEVPLVTPPKPATEPLPTDLNEPEWLDKVEEIAGIARWIFAGAAGLLILLLLIGTIRRGASRSHSKKAMDHLEGATYREYGQQPKRGKRSIVYGHSGEKEAAEAPAETPADPKENTAQDGELMAETLKRLYSEPEVKAENAGQSTAEGETGAEAEPTVQETVKAEETTTHRRRSRK